MRAYYQSTGYKNTASVLTLLEGVVFFVPALYVFARIGFNAVWLSFATAPTLAVCTILIYMQSKAKRDGKNNFLMLGRESEAQVIDFSIENKIEKATEASEKIRTLCLTNKLSSRDANILALATEELCTNTAKFAYGEKSQFIDIFLKIYDDKTILRVRDNGAIFNPIEHIDDSGELISGLKTLKSLPAEIIYNRVIGFNNTILTLKNSHV